MRVRLRWVVRGLLAASVVLAVLALVVALVAVHHPNSAASPAEANRSSSRTSRGR